MRDVFEFKVGSVLFLSYNGIYRITLFYLTVWMIVQNSTWFRALTLQVHMQLEFGHIIVPADVLTPHSYMVMQILVNVWPVEQERQGHWVVSADRTENPYWAHPGRCHQIIIVYNIRF